MKSPCTFVQILQPRWLLTKKQNGLCCGYLSGFLVAQKTKRARGNSDGSGTQNPAGIRVFTVQNFQKGIRF